MNTQQEKYAELQSKLEKGLEKLKKISIDDKDGIGAALIKLHGAMEDFVRLEIAQKAPHLRASVEDLKTGWKDLLEHGRTFLGFTANDCDIISEANFQRNKFAHGRDFTYTYSDLINYAQFVQKWCNSHKSSTFDLKSRQIIEPSKKYDPPPTHRPNYDNHPQTSSSPSTFILWFTFFFLPPVWAILIIRDRNQGVFAKLIAFSMIIMLFLCIIGAIPASATFRDALQSMLEQPNLQSIPDGGPSIIEASTSAATSTLPTMAIPESDINSTCTIVWAEYQLDDLGGKSRATVWEEIVMARVNGSGMAAREFYDSVVERNPVLVTDGYEFKKGKTYLLPTCQ